MSDVEVRAEDRAAAEALWREIAVGPHGDRGEVLEVLDIYCKSISRIVQQAFVDEASPHFAAYRVQVAAEERARCVGLVTELRNVANEYIDPADLNRLICVMDHKPVVKSAAELLQEQIGRSMDREGPKYPTID